jgi:hypothetical protein
MAKTSAGLCGIGAAALVAAVAAWGTTGPASAAVVLSPVALTGYNDGLMVPDTATSNGNGGSNFSGYVTATFGGGNSTSGNYFYQTGLSGELIDGMPSNGQVDYTGSNFAATYQLGQFGGNNNVLLLFSPTFGTPVFGGSAPSTGTLDLVQPGKYTSLSVLDTSGYASSSTTGAVTLNLLNSADASVTVVTDYGAPDWFSGSGGGTTPDGNSYTPVLSGVGWISSPRGFEDNPTAEFYQSTLNLENLDGYVNGSTTLSTGLNLSGDTLESLAFTVVSSSGTSSSTQTAIFAVSGQPVPEPGALALFGGAWAGLLLLKRRRERLNASRIAAGRTSLLRAYF